MAKISIVIPVYNTAKFLDRCMLSVLGQTHHDLEIILVDDGSSDDSPQLCDAYAARDERVKVIHQENGGLSAARNKGLEHVCGSFIGFVDSDDWIEPDMFSYLMELLKKTGAGIAEIMPQRTSGEGKAIVQPEENVQVFEHDEMFVHYFEHNEFGVVLRLYKSELFKDVTFDVGRMNEDVVAGFLVFKEAARLAASNQRKYHYFINTEGFTKGALSQKDFDLLYSGERLDELTESDTSPVIRKLALQKKHRGTFTLLVKMALYGCKDDIDEAEVKRSLQKETRKHYFELMRSAMPINRKILLTACCTSYPLVKAAAGLYRGLKRAR